MGKSLIADYLLGNHFSQVIVSHNAIAQHKANVRWHSCRGEWVDWAKPFFHSGKLIYPGLSNQPTGQGESIGDFPQKGVEPQWTKSLLKTGSIRCSHSSRPECEQRSADAWKAFFICGISFISPHPSKRIPFLWTRHISSVFMLVGSGISKPSSSQWFTAVILLNNQFFKRHG